MVVRKSSATESSPENAKAEEEEEEMSTSSFPDEVLEHVLVFLTRHEDRNAVSQVCKAWCSTEGASRKKVFIGNCYALSPEDLVRRFRKITTLVMKGRPRFTDFGLVPHNWGAHMYPWIRTMALHYPGLEELRLKRMTVSDESLEMIARCFSSFRALSLTSCDGFSTDGLAHITRHCGYVFLAVIVVVPLLLLHSCCRKLSSSLLVGRIIITGNLCFGVCFQGDFHMLILYHGMDLLLVCLSVCLTD